MLDFAKLAAQMKGAALLRPPLLLTHFKETTALVLSESLPESSKKYLPYV